MDIASIANRVATTLALDTASPPYAIVGFGLINKNGVLGAYIGNAGGLVTRRNTVAAAADGAIAPVDGAVFITKGTAAALTLASPVSGTDDGVRIEIVSTTAAAHTVTCTAGFGGGTTARDVATFGGAINDSMIIEAYQGLWYLVSAPRNVTIA